MTKCPIYNREILEDYLWCKDCSSDCENSTIDVYDDDLAAIAEWAANRAREFEREKTKVLLENAEVLRSAQEREIGRLVTRVMELEREIRLPCAHVNRVKHLETENTQLKEQVRELSSELKDATEAILRLSEALLAKREEEILKGE